MPKRAIVEDELSLAIKRSKIYKKVSVGKLYHVDGGLARVDAIEDVAISAGFPEGVVVIATVYLSMRSLPIPLFQRRSRELCQAGFTMLEPVQLIQDNSLSILRTNQAFPKYSAGFTYGKRYKLRWGCDCDSIHAGTIKRLPSIKGEFDRPDETLRISWCGHREIQYTMADVFCGAGGASRGAVGAGLKPIWALDNHEPTARTYALNFPDSEIHVCSIEQLSGRITEVDVLHFSPPCQGFSLMNTAENGGRQGPSNRDLSLALLHIVKLARPRIVTMEQVPGILSDEHRLYFETIIRAFVEDLGFSVMWKIVNCIEHGVPANRKRLFLIASCPGQPLPSWPHPQPSIPVSHYLPTSNLTFYNGTILASSTTRKEDGRPYTIPELAAIQSFPVSHTFHPRYARMQIGNAVPPSLARSMFINCRNALV